MGLVSAACAAQGLPSGSRRGDVAKREVSRPGKDSIRSELGWASPLDFDDPPAYVPADGKEGAVKPFECEHFVVGAGLLGLATADHLLRRGARGVWVAERGGALSAGRPGRSGAVIRDGHPALTALEDRGRVLLEGGREYLDEELPFLRCGSLRIPADEATPPGCERLVPSEVAERFPWELTPSTDARFSPADGAIETLPIISALHARIRAQGGRLLLDTEVLELREAEDGVHVTAQGRAGRAARVHLAAGADNPRFLDSLGVRHDWRVEIVHSFELATAQEGGTVVWLPESRATLTPIGASEWELELAVDGELGGDCAVDWTLLEKFRRAEADRFPWIVNGGVRRGRALPRLACDPAGVVLGSRAGRIAAAGAFGPHGLGLFSSVGEQLAERGLAPLASVGALLEEG